MGELPSKAPVVGTPISRTSYAEVLESIEQRPKERATVYCFCNVHSVMSARRDPNLAEALRAADVATPDGVPLVWLLRATADSDQARVYAPELMTRAFEYGLARGWRHFLYGATPETLDALAAAAQKIAPGAVVAGAIAPPFRPQSEDEISADLQAIRDARPDVLWVGLGMPKQELWMHRVRSELPGIALCGVGASFDFLAGNVPQAPPALQRAGLEWAFRLYQEPRRLWRRYIWNNPAYLVLMAGQIVAHKLKR